MFCLLSFRWRSFQGTFDGHYYRIAFEATAIESLGKSSRLPDEDQNPFEPEVEVAIAVLKLGDTPNWQAALHTFCDFFCPEPKKALLKYKTEASQI